jgi:DNA-directed RNA polymerase specialized sigma24 family protein
LRRPAAGSSGSLAAEALRKLTPDAHRVISLAVWEGLSESEIAALSGSPLNTMKSPMRRGFLAIRETLGGGRGP